MKKLIAAIPLIVTCSVAADEGEVLTIDRVVPSNVEFSFSYDKDISPKPSDFALVNYVVMSNERGERWAVLTLTNTSSGQRMLEQDHILATFADGSKQAPTEVKLNFNGKETQSITVSFGQSKFPILSIVTDNN